jgi:hypothetical protein
MDFDKRVLPLENPARIKIATYLIQEAKVPVEVVELSNNEAMQKKDSPTYGLERLL